MPLLLSLFTIFTFSLVAIETLIDIKPIIGFRQISVLAIFFVIWLCRRGNRTVTKNFILAFLALALILIVGSILSGIPSQNMIMGVFMTLEFAIIFYFASGTRVSVIQLEKFSLFFLIFLFINTAIALVGYVETFPDAMRQNFGVQGDAGFFASGLNIGVILLLGIHLFRKKNFLLFCSAILSVIICLTVIKKAILINIVIWIIWILFGGNRNATKKLMLLTSIFICTSVLTVGALIENIQQNVSYFMGVDIEEHVRLIMYFASLQIAIDYFPLGSGAGSFGSLASITNYFSSLYDLYGVSIVPTNSIEAVENGTHTLLDTYWPHIIAESGAIGTILFLYLFSMPIRYSIFAYKKFNLQPEIKFCAFIALCIPLALFLEGFALYTTEAPSFLIFLGGISGYCYRLVRLTVIKLSQESNVQSSDHAFKSI